MTISSPITATMALKWLSRYHKSFNTLRLSASMDIDVKASSLRFLIELTYMLFFSAITVIFFITGMLLTKNNLPSDYLLSLLIAGLVGGFWGYGLQEVPKTIEKEISKVRSYQSRRVLVKKWFSYLSLVLILFGVLGVIMGLLGMVRIPQ